MEHKIRLHTHWQDQAISYLKKALHSYCLFWPCLVSWVQMIFHCKQNISLYEKLLRQFVTLIIRSVTETDKSLAMLDVTSHFPFPVERGLADFRIFLFSEDDLVTISRSFISNCSFGSLEITPKLSLTRDLRKLSFISPIETDSTEPWEVGYCEQMD